MNNFLFAAHTIDGGRIDAPHLWRFEAINHAANVGAVLWCREA